MLPKCFANYLGIRGLCSEDIQAPPTSGLYVNDLESISVATSALIANDENATGVNLMQEKIAQAIYEAKEDTFKYLHNISMFRTDSILCQESWGEWGDSFLDYSDVERGFFIDKTKRCGRGIVVITKVEILAAETISTSLIINDGFTSTSYPVDLEANIPFELYPEYTLKYNSAYITVSGLSPNNSTKHNYCCDNPCWDYLTVTGWDGDSMSANTFGLKIEVQIRCDEWAFMCAIKHLLPHAIRYKFGELMAKEATYTTRTNMLTLNKDLLFEKVEYYRKKYEGEMSYIFTKLNKFLNSYVDPCFICRNAKISVQRP